MEKKIIRLTKEKEEKTCLVCCERVATVKFEINRPKHKDNIITFSVCDECLAKMQKDIEVCE